MRDSRGGVAFLPSKEKKDTVAMEGKSASERTSMNAELNSATTAAQREKKSCSRVVREAREKETEPAGKGTFRS